ncbi:interleukin-12 subunit alpha isoform X2 [Pristis pectinata]|uniref:interleukin-12 subunit alpha isoform X2 n=1 Tax=Pristis pectinata TaxID=685728 RepID=UPI00223E4934|nr:interleukin-12 subunit alpha isoform X2 [Pristis pectinata]
MMILREATGLAPRLWKVAILITIYIQLFCFSVGSPIEKHHKIDVGKCLNISRELLKEPDVTEGFNCSDTEIVLEDITANQTSTVWACTPEQEATRCKERGKRQNCLRSSQCYQNITADLQIYQAKLQNFTHVTNNVCKNIADLLKALNSDSTYEDVYLEGGSTTDEEEKAAINFPQRMALCKILQAFKLRTITINRVMNYMSEAEE